MGIKESYRGPAGKTLPGLNSTSEEAVEKSRHVFAQNRVTIAYLFGSYARGSADSSSDIDLAVYCDLTGEELYTKYRQLMIELQETLGTERLDLLLLNDAPPYLQFEVVSSGTVIYAKSEEALNDFEARVIQRYQDTAYLRKIQNFYLEKRAREWSSKKKA